MGGANIQRENRRVKRNGLVVCLAVCFLGSLVFAYRLWSWVLNFDPGFSFNHAPVPSGPPLTRGVTLLLVDGLRLDASRRMPVLNGLRSRGADVEAYAGTPSFSRPGRATVAVGAFPWVHGVTTNRQKRSLALDNIIRRVGAMGGTCRIAGSKIWGSLFDADIAKCGAYRLGESKEGPGAFERQIGDVRASQQAGFEFVLAQPSSLRILDIVSTDFAAHEYGGASRQYADEVARTDAVLAELVKRLDLENETLVVTADHGHKDEGGHGGEEAPVLAIPIVMVGAGIQPASLASATQADIAPTIAALLGTGLPAGSHGRPIESILLGDDAKKAMVKGASLMQKEAFDRAVSERLGHPSVGASPRSAEDAVQEYRTADRSSRRPVATLGGVLVGLLFGLLVRANRPDRFAVGAGLLAGLVVFAASLAGPSFLRLPSLSFSAINYDENLIPFFRWIMTLAATGTLIATLTSIVVAWVRREPGRSSEPEAQAGATGLLLSAILAIAIFNEWYRNGLLLSETLPGPDQMVRGFAIALSLAASSLVTLSILGFFRLRSRSQIPQS